MVRAAAKCGKYLYAIVPATGEQTFGFTGIAGAPVYTVANSRIAAVVSDIADQKSDPNAVTWPPSRRFSRGC
jgi:Gas vesicle synthesis protein GvpL/GvpF